MKDLAEIYQALLDGEVLTTAGRRLRLHNGVQQYLTVNDIWVDELSNWAFHSPDEWSIYKEPKWYDNIPEGGVICKVRDNLSNRWLTSVIVDYDTKRILPYVTASGGGYRYVEPLDLTKPLAPQLEPV